MLAGQDIIYSGRFAAAHAHFLRLASAYPRDASGPAMAASALIWWGEARGEETYLADSIDALLGVAAARARGMLESARSDDARLAGHFWLGTALGYRARQAELRGSYWRAAQDAKAMNAALRAAVAIDPACVDCLLGLGIYEYALARAGALARLAARLVGLGSGDADHALRTLRRVSEEGHLTRTEGAWVYASALLREAARDPRLRDDGMRLIAGLAETFPANPVFRRALGPGAR